MSILEYRDDIKYKQSYLTEKRSATFNFGHEIICLLMKSSQVEDERTGGQAKRDRSWQHMLSRPIPPSFTPDTIGT